MNQFMQIKKMQKQQGNTNGENKPELLQSNVTQAFFNLNELKKRANEKETKESYTFKLFPRDRKRIDSLAIEYGFVTPSGKPNASAFMTTLIQMISEME